MHFVDGDNLNGYVMGIHKDRFSYGFAGLEFVIGNKAKPQLMTHNPAAQLRRDLMDENNALRASVEATQQQRSTEVTALRTELENLKKDSDKDGVADHFDKCPGTADSVKVDGAGCPLPKVEVPKPQTTTVIVTEEDRRIVREAIRNLEFDLGKAVIRERSFASLDKVAEILVNKNFSLKLAGHTDNIGSDAANLRLSKDRAESVKEYLVSKGANPSRIEATGYGESQPIASNKTAKGRQQNRRVEFTLY
jgi:OOP family OmpA-OmpF porin